MSPLLSNAIIFLIIHHIFLRFKILKHHINIQRSRHPQQFTSTTFTNSLNKNNIILF